MTNIEKYIFTAVRNALVSSHGESGIFVTGEYTEAPPKFPCVQIEEIDNFAQEMNGSNTETVTGIAYEVHVYSISTSGKKTECKSILAEVDSILTPMGFKRTMCNPVANISDISVCQYVARYTAAYSNNTIFRR